MSMIAGSGVGLLLAILAAAPAQAQQQARQQQQAVQLSLSDALGRALEQNEQVRLGEAQVEVARAQVGVARSAALPQINTVLNYNRALRSVFQDAGFTIPDSLR